MGQVIHIRFGYDLSTRKQNELRYNMEMAEWRRQFREAEAERDYDRMDRLNSDYERVGLP
jgi:hypothetical protein